MKKITLLFIALTSYIGYSQATPTEAAPTPPARNAADVISFFSNSYTNVPIGSWSGFGGASIEDLQISGNDTKKITFDNFLGIDFSNNRIDASAMTNFHLDIWTPDAVLDKVLVAKFSQWGGTVGEVSAFLLTVEHTSTTSVPALVTGSWLSIDVPISAFSSPQTRTDLAQLIFSSTLGTVYFDNLYFYKGTALKAPSFKEANISMYPNPVKNSLNIEAKSNIKNIAVYNVLGQKVIEKNPNKNSTSLNTGNLQSGVYIIKANVDGKISSSKFVKE